jgi:hypothetical protein
MTDEAMVPNPETKKKKSGFRSFTEEELMHS